MKKNVLNKLLSGALQVGIERFPEKDSDCVWLSNYFPGIQMSLIIYSPEEIFGYVRTPFNLFKDTTSGILNFLPVKIVRVLKQGYGDVYEFKLPNTQEEIDLSDLTYRTECCIIELQTLAEMEAEFDKDGDPLEFDRVYKKRLKSALLRYSSYSERNFHETVHS